MLDKEDDLTSDEQDYLTLLGLLIERYDADYEKDIELRGVELIQALLEERNLTQHDLLPIFKTTSKLTAIFNNQRQLTVKQINKLAQFFGLPHSLFFPTSFLTKI